MTPPKTTLKPRAESKVPEDAHDPLGKLSDRERLRAIIVVFVTYPITPTKETKKVAESKPWLEFLSLLLKVALAAFALYEGVFT